MTLELPALSEPVEINGVSFQTVISPTILPIPEKVKDGKTWFKAGMRINNNSSKDYYFFDFPAMLRPSIKLSTGQVFISSFNSDLRFCPRNHHVMLVKPTESADILWNACLAWIQFGTNIIKTKKKIRGVPEPYQNDPKLRFLFPFREHIVLYYAAMNPFPPKPDKYQLGFSYSLQSNLENFQLNSFYRYIIPSVYSNIWTGSVNTLFVPVEIVEREIAA